MNSCSDFGHFASEPLCKDIPYFGLTRLAAKAFALEQYVNSVGFSRFSEWFAKLAVQGYCALGHVLEADEVSGNEQSETLRETFGYEVAIHIARANEATKWIVETLTVVGRIDGLPLDVRNGILLDEFAKSQGHFTFASWFAAMSEADYLIGCKIEECQPDISVALRTYCVVLKRKKIDLDENDCVR